MGARRACPQTPPLGSRSGPKTEARYHTNSLANVHDDVAELAEAGGVLHRLGQEVRGVVVRGDVGDLDLKRLDHVTQEVVAALDVLHAVVVLGVVRDVARALAVGKEADFEPVIYRPLRPELNVRVANPSLISGSSADQWRICGGSVH